MTFKLRKSLVALMIIAMVMSTGLSAYATDWPTYQGNDIHNGILTDGAEISESPCVTRIDLPKNGSGWDGVDSAAVMETKNGNTYSYVLYDGYKAEYGKGGGRLVKVDCTASTPQVVWEKQITQNSGFQLSSPYLDTKKRCIYVGASGFNQRANNDELALTGGAITDWSVSTVGTTLEDSKVVVSGNQTVTMTQTNTNLTSGKTHRSATGVKINGSNVNMTITAKLNGTTVGSKTLDASYLIDGHYYLNENFQSAAESAVNTGTNNTLQFTYEISGNDSNTVEIEYCQLYEQNSSITKVTNIDEEPTTEWSLNVPNNAQINTPIVKNGDYLYFGTWSGNAGTYYQFDMDNEELKEFNPGNGGFYWAGAVIDGDYVYFGGDKGYLYARPVGDDFDNTSEGSVVNLSTIGGVESGNVRSTISLVDGQLYFTSQGGYLWSFTPGEGTPTFDWKAQLSGTSTSTPTVVGDNIYVGYYSGFTAGGVQKVSKTGKHEVSSIATPGPVQSSILVYTKDGVDYLYFTTNSGTGAGYCFNGSNGTKVWQTPGDTYALQGMAYSGGVLTFGNDYDHFYVIGERYVPPTPPETSLPNNTGELLWPADSSEVTLWFGQIDEQYTAVNKGMNIQGTANSNVYSVCDGVVAYKGYSSTYGNLLYVDFKYNKITMQVRYGHLSESSKLKVGDVVKQGDVVGQMGRDANNGKGLIEIVFCESKDSKPCDKNGKNIQLVDPIQYLERPMCDISYLEKDMTTMLDTTGLGETPVLPSIIWPWEDKNDPDIRYRENKDVNIKQAYLRKLIVEYGREIDKTITHKNIEKKGIITYDAKSGITTVKLNGRSKRYGVSLGNAQIKNNRMVVNWEDVWYDLIGKTYNSPEGGTWYASKLNNMFGGVWQSVYLPKEIAKDLYIVTEGGQVEKVLYDKAVGEMAAPASAGFCSWVLSECGITISVAKASVFAAAVVFGYDLAKAWDRDCFKDAVMKCGDNEFVRITYFITDSGITNSYEVTKEIKDVYRSQGTFKSGHYEGYSKVNK